jgi:hypothetical protein
MDLQAPGSYLIHSECAGNPHCIAAVLSGDDSNIVHVYDGDHCWEIELKDLEACAAESIDKSTLVTFRVYPHGATIPPMPEQPFPDAADLLLDLQAGGKPGCWRSTPLSDDTVMDVEVDHLPVDESAGCDLSQEDDGGDDSVINVGDQLLRALSHEVTRALQQTSGTDRRTKQDRFACPLCPFRAFSRRSYLQGHIRNQHRAEKQYVCSGTKQLRVIMAL